MDFVKGHPTNPNQIKALKSLWADRDDQWKAKEIDPRFLDILERLNSVPDIATLYHCSGHIAGEDSGGSGLVSSYMVICATGQMVDRMNQLAEAIHNPNPQMLEHPDYVVAIQMGWEVMVSDTLLVPWYHGTSFIGPSANTWCIYLKLDEKEDLDGLKTVAIWNDLLNTYIFN